MTLKIMLAAGLGALIMLPPLHANSQESTSDQELDRITYRQLKRSVRCSSTAEKIASDDDFKTNHVRRKAYARFQYEVKKDNKGRTRSLFWVHFGDQGGETITYDYRFYLYDDSCSLVRGTYEKSSYDPKTQTSKIIDRK